MQRSEDHGRSLDRLHMLAASVTSAAIFAACALWYLYRYHPAEDAYIVFRYAENLAAGRGIVFNPAGPVAEGATDFLWMAVLALGVWLGADVAVAALTLNAVGAALMSWAILRLLPERSRWVTACVAVSVPFLAGAPAALGGFSSQLYCGLCALGVSLVIRPARAPSALPWLALVLGLLRPDGVIVAGGLYGAALAGAWAEPQTRRALIRAGLLPVGVAAAYYGWRTWYFGELLPLPLQVKSHGPGMPWAGVPYNIAWYASPLGPIPLLIGIAVFTANVSATVRRRVLAAMLPGALLFVALTRAMQTQNVGWRFQAPIYAMLLVAMAALVSETAAAHPRWRRLAPWGLLAATIPAWLGFSSPGDKIYLDGLAPRIGTLLDEQSRVLVTEAGQLPYWTRATVYDAVGLNTPETARRPPTVEALGRFDPDLVLIDVTGVFDVSRVQILEGDPDTADVLRLDPASLGQGVDPRDRAFLEPRETWEPTWLHTKVAALVTLELLSTHGEMEVFAVRHQGCTIRCFPHIWGIRRGTPVSDELTELLRSAPAEPFPSYASLKGFVGTSGGSPVHVPNDSASRYQIAHTSGSASELPAEVSR